MTEIGAGPVSADGDCGTAIPQTDVSSPQLPARETAPGFLVERLSETRTRFSCMRDAAKLSGNDEP